jgi:hypothetical protein
MSSIRGEEVNNYVHSLDTFQFSDAFRCSSSECCCRSNLETLLHLLKGSLGTGILAMPNAFLRAGYVLGVAGTIVIGIICTYCIHQLVSACRRHCHEISKLTLRSPKVTMCKKDKGIPQQARCGPEGSRRLRLPDFHDIRHMKVVSLSASRTDRLYPQEMFLVLIFTRG